MLTTTPAIREHFSRRDEAFREHFGKSPIAELRPSILDHGAALLGDQDEAEADDRNLIAWLRDQMAKRSLRNG